MEQKIKDGMYTVVYPTGEYRTLRVRTGKNSFSGKRILSYKDSKAQFGWTGFGFLTDSNSVSFWNRFKLNQPAERLARIERAVKTIVDNPRQAGLSYAERERRCCRCGKDLTVPASLHAGLGPDCAGKGHWNGADNQAAYDAMLNA